MSFTAYATAVAGSVLTAAFWNQQVRDNGNILKSQLDDEGHLLFDVRSVAGSDSVDDDDDILHVNADGTITLPASPVQGKPYIIKADSGADVTVDGNGNTIDGEATFVLGEYDAAWFAFNGSEWSVF